MLKGLGNGNLNAKISNRGEINEQKENKQYHLQIAAKRKELIRKKEEHDLVVDGLFSE